MPSITLDDVLERIRSLDVKANDEVLGFHTVNVDEYSQRQVAIILRAGEEAPRYYISMKSKGFKEIPPENIAAHMVEYHTPFTGITHCRMGICYAIGPRI